MRLSKTDGFLRTAQSPITDSQYPRSRTTVTDSILHTALFKVDPLSRICNINVRKLMIFITLWLASVIRLLFFAMRCSKTYGFLHNRHLQLRSSLWTCNIRNHELVVFSVFWLRTCNTSVNEQNTKNS